MRQIRKTMRTDFMKTVVLLEEHPIMQKSISELDVDEQESAYFLLDQLAQYVVEGKFTQIDYFQMARIFYNLGELANILSYNSKVICSHYQNASRYLVSGGFDLSICKWMDLLSLRITDH